MGGLAQLAVQAGHKVTGCDANVYPPMSDQLERAGIELVQGFGKEQLAVAPDLWVIGNVVSRGNPLMEAILDAGLPYVSGPQWMCENILQGRHVMAVAGTHGKTTTTAMLSWILQYAGLEPGFLVGGVPQDFGVSARLGKGKHFVIEADEYDTAFFDKRSKFVHYRPRTAILNNLEYDHADIFENLAAIEKQFHHLVRTIPASGALIVNGRCAALDSVLDKGVWCRVERFDRDDGWTVDSNGTVAFGGRPYGLLQLRLAGRHNQLNALAAIAAARDAGVTPETAVEALNAFVGVKRRLELKGCVNGVTVIDDFAHHPTAIQETVAALRSKIGPERRILAVLEPRSNTMKLGVMKSRLPEALKEADKVFCFSGKGVDWDTAEALAPLGDKASHYKLDVAPLVRDVVAQSRDGDVILCMSNGSFGGIHQQLLCALNQR